ncbi:25S rRNA (adenine(2142)-N(1))-methyltransferase [Malassezia vespertilionis]|nr:25S rRNA (adenine(2142)-N(1))-methyltransferase [Malassezia vespertilionis]WFD08618.1 25S rRNA (adenine(2142)-N(1))-methyltransferase [Malassezia vespertilionis]
MQEETKAKAPRREKLIRPRGKRGGVKHRPKGSVKQAHTVAIAKYHALEKQIAQTTDIAERSALEKQQRKLGGLAKYQDQSTTGSATDRGGESGKWCAKTLKNIIAPDTKISLLDVGAIAGTAYTKYTSWITTTSIDLNPRSENVHQSDFFDWPAPSAEARYNVVALSLVINFVGDLHKRGELLLHAHQYLRPDGYLYIVLPLACVKNSRYMTHAHFTALVNSAGYSVVCNEDSAKLTRWLLQTKAPKSLTKSQRKLSSKEKLMAQYWDGIVYKKHELLPGDAHNNFAILLP